MALCAAAVAVAAAVTSAARSARHCRKDFLNVMDEKHVNRKAGSVDEETSLKREWELWRGRYKNLRR